MFHGRPRREQAREWKSTKTSEERVNDIRDVILPVFRSEGSLRALHLLEQALIKGVVSDRFSICLAHVQHDSVGIKDEMKERRPTL